MDGEDEEKESIARMTAAMRVLEQASSIPLDQEGSVIWPPTSYWARLRQKVRCKLGRHAWGKPWRYRPLVPAEHQVAKMISEGAPWPCYEIKDCAACGERHRKRVA
jgi:hypothetical protein